MCLPDSQGLVTFDKLVEATPGMPTLVLCAIGDDATAREALRRGTKDYLVESHVDSHSFLRAKRNMVERETAADVLFKETPACSSYSQFNRRDCSLHRIEGKRTYLNVVAVYSR
jgi:ActR/RegA family two-component response regulator